jgi:ribose transport system permease protein
MSALSAVAQRTLRIRVRSMASLVSAGAPYVALIVLAFIYATRQPGAFSLYQLNNTTVFALPLVLVSVGQMLVITTGGIDLSVGGVLALTTTLAATHFGSGGLQMVTWIVILLVGGLAIGAVNGVLAGLLGLEPFIATLGTWSLCDGAALLILKVPGGSIPASWAAIAEDSPAGLNVAVWVVIALIVLWLWFKRTRTGRSLVSVGSSADASFASGIALGRYYVLAYALSGLFAAVAGLYLVMQMSSGSAQVGDPYILTSVAAAVIGGNRLSGGRPMLGGTITAAYVLTLVGSVIFVFGLNSELSTLISGLLLIAVVAVRSVGDRRTGEV